MNSIIICVHANADAFCTFRHLGPALLQTRANVRTNMLPSTGFKRNFLVKYPMKFMKRSFFFC